MIERASILVVCATALVGCVGDQNATAPSFDAGTIPGEDGSVLGLDAAGGSCLGGAMCGDGACHDLASDHANCGACAHACGDGQVCSSGACAASCGAGEIACGGSCVDPQTSRASCGASGDCTGANAGKACGAAEACVAGKCVAACGSSANASLKICGGVCTDTDFDVDNCGGCGTKCSAPNGTPICLYATCGVTACATDFADCNHDPSDGCEENLQTSATNCGACGAVCNVGPCTAGACGPDPEWASAALPADLRGSSDFVIEHGGALTIADGGAADATIADAAIVPDAGGMDFDASACADAGGVRAAQVSACAEAGACDDVVLDRATGLLWTRWTIGSTNTIAAAQCWCAGLSIAGLTGWRLPTRLEIATLPDYGRTNPVLDPAVFPFASGTSNLLSASVSKRPIDPAYGFQLSVAQGDVDEWGAGGTYQDFVCVR